MAEADEKYWKLLNTSLLGSFCMTPLTFFQARFLDDEKND